MCVREKERERERAVRFGALCAAIEFWFNISGGIRSTVVVCSVTAGQ